VIKNFLGDVFLTGVGNETSQCSMSVRWLL